jgi:hypothetical protein
VKINRPRSRQRPHRLLSDAELRRSGLRRTPHFRGTLVSQTKAQPLQKLALLVWNGPAIFLSSLVRLKSSL